MYLSSLISYQSDPSSVNVLVGEQRADDDKSETDDNSDEDGPENEPEYGSGIENDGKEDEGRSKGNDRPKCIHRTR